MSEYSYVTRGPPSVPMHYFCFFCFSFLKFRLFHYKLLLPLLLSFYCIFPPLPDLLFSGPTSPMHSYIYEYKDTHILTSLPTISCVPFTFLFPCFPSNTIFPSPSSLPLSLHKDQTKDQTLHRVESCFEC